MSAPDGPGPLLAVRDLVVRRGDRVVLDVSGLDLAPGRVMALVGPNGAGKTTLLKALAGLEAPSEGLLSLQGRPLASRSERAAYRRRVTMVFQQPLLFDTTVAGNLEAGLRLRGLDGERRRAKVAEAAERFGLTGLLGRSARTLSGGEAQRTSLARALAIDPEILFLDEPFSALDPPTRDALLDDLAAVLRQTRTTAVFSSHDQGEALRLADSLVVLREGRIIQTGPTAEVINHPVDAFVAGFLGMEAVFEARVLASADGLLELEAGGRTLHGLGQAAPGTLLRVGVRPENVVLAGHPQADTSARNQVPGRVVRILPRGPYAKVELDCGFFLTAHVTRRSQEDLGLAEGSAVVAAFKATAVHVLKR